MIKVTIPQKEDEIKTLEIQTIPNLVNQIDKLKMYTLEPYLRETHILGDILSTGNPVKPNKKMVLAVSLVAGLMLGVFLVFFLEFLRGSKKDDETEN